MRLPFPGETRPLMRGHMHLAAALVAPIALAVLLLLADTPRGYVGAASFGIGLILLYSVSAAYHLVRWKPHVRGVVARIDQANIFIFIAASYTPFCLVMSPPWQATLLPLVWTLAIGGAVARAAWPGMPRSVAVVGYLALGWVGIAAAPELASIVEPAGLLLLVTGGLVFSAGALAYALRWPDPVPNIFGYHEVFHACVVAGTAVHYGVIAGWVIHLS